MAEIQLTRGHVAIVDDNDFDWLNQWKWFTRESHGIWYAERRTLASEGRGRRNVAMHAFLMRPDPGLEVDHRDGDGLNNRRSNLRVCVRAHNLLNRRLRSDNSTGFKGVALRGGRYFARVQAFGQEHSLGYYRTAEEAARAYDRGARVHHGEFARLNFPDEGAA